MKKNKEITFLPILNIMFNFYAEKTMLTKYTKFGGYYSLKFLKNFYYQYETTLVPKFQLLFF